MDQLEIQTNDLQRAYKAQYENIKNERAKLAEATANLEKERLQVQRSITDQRQAFEVEKKLINSKMNFKSAKIRLNVGGTPYATLIATLNSVPGSMLEAMFSGRHDLPYDEDDKSYFIDRDGTPFRYILNYLRDPSQFELPSDPDARRDLLKEANYYCLADLATMLNIPIAFQGQESQILTRQHQESVAIMMGGKPTLRLVLTGNASTNHTKFYQATSELGKILIVFKTNTNVVFGACVTVGQMQQAPASDFLFTFYNPNNSNKKKKGDDGGEVGIKFTTAATSSHDYIYGGGQQYYYVGNSGLQLASDLTAFNRFQCGQPCHFNTPAATSLCGTTTFQPSCIEVFDIVNC